MNCDNCTHYEVCKYRTEYEKICHQINNMDIPYSDGKTVSMKPIHCYDWIEVEVVCKYFVFNGTLTR